MGEKGYSEQDAYAAAVNGADNARKQEGAAITPEQTQVGPERGRERAKDAGMDAIRNVASKIGSLFGKLRRPAAAVGRALGVAGRAVGEAGASVIGVTMTRKGRENAAKECDRVTTAAVDMAAEKWSSAVEGGKRRVGDAREACRVTVLESRETNVAKIVERLLARHEAKVKTDDELSAKYVEPAQDKAQEIMEAAQRRAEAVVDRGKAKYEAAKQRNAEFADDLRREIADQKSKLDMLRAKRDGRPEGAGAPVATA